MPIATSTPAAASPAPVRRGHRGRLPACAASSLLALASATAAGAQVTMTTERASQLEEIVVTATRRPERLLDVPLSIGPVGPETIELVGSTHHAEVMNRVAGVMIQRGTGQESLTAIRSPVLTGAGSCGAFLFLENSVPIRPVGFCNVNALFEVNTEQARAIEVLRGPGSALYGSSAMHGTVNVLQPSPAELPRLGLGLDGGPANYWRLKMAGAHDAGHAAYGLSALYANDGGWRAVSGYHEAKLNAVATSRLGEAPVRVDLAAMTLDQDTAGFVTGKDAYEDLSLSESNPVAGAYRDASAVRLTGLVEKPLDGGAQLELRPYLRTSRTEFEQHFLLGRPIERNGQDSGGLMTSIAWDDVADWSLVAGLDVELGDSTLVEDQALPTTGGTPGASAIRPAGRHYDYDVRSAVASVHAQGERRFLERWRLGAGLRAEWIRYEYDNRMLDGNTDENGVPCTPACLYTRPADRTDRFSSAAPKLSLMLDLSPQLVTYVNYSYGYRAPELTELYRLQRGQQVADLDPEELDSLEFGLKGAWSDLELAVAFFDMDKRGVILRESNGFNVANGRTNHRGVEYGLRWQMLSSLELAVAGTYAKHRYDFSRQVEGGDSISAGNDVDTAPREIGRAALGWRPAGGLELEAEWLVVGDYWLDAANEHRYEGHELLNLRGLWRVAPRWSLAVRINNALDRRYADRADFAFGSYRYFPGRPRSVFAEIAWAL
jgi:outer membrane receptor protein involved in Fe transport